MLRKEHRFNFGVPLLNFFFHLNIEWQRVFVIQHSGKSLRVLLALAHGISILLLVYCMSLK